MLNHRSSAQLLSIEHGKLAHFKMVFAGSNIKDSHGDNKFLYKKEDDREYFWHIEDVVLDFH